MGWRCALLLFLSHQPQFFVIRLPYSLLGWARGCKTSTYYYSVRRIGMAVESFFHRRVAGDWLWDMNNEKKDASQSRVMWAADWWTCFFGKIHWDEWVPSWLSHELMGHRFSALFGAVSIRPIGQGGESISWFHHGTIWYFTITEPKDLVLGVFMGPNDEGVKTGPKTLSFFLVTQKRPRVFLTSTHTNPSKDGRSNVPTMRTMLWTQWMWPESLFCQQKGSFHVSPVRRLWSSHLHYWRQRVWWWTKDQQTKSNRADQKAILQFIR